jgi:hypothetical protein
VPLPARLRELVEHLRGPSGSTLFGDLELDNLADDFLVAYFGKDEPELMARFPHKLAFFARQGGGGQVGLWMLDDAPSDRWPVVSLDSEGQMLVVGDSMEDFLRIMAGRWNEDDAGTFTGDEKFRAWATGIGVQPHEHPEQRLRELNPATLQFRRWFAEQQRDIHRALYPDRPLVIDVLPGVSVGPIRLGAPRTEVDASLGAPRFASWQKPTTPEQTAFYEYVPYVVETDRATTTVTGVTLYAGHHIVRLPDGFEPLHATEADVTKWLSGHCADAAVDGLKLTSQSLGLSMSLTTGHGRSHDATGYRWVEGLSLAPASAT